MKLIAMSNGQSVTLDDADFERLAVHAWHLSEKGYVTRRVRTPHGKRVIYMHREILGWVARDVDHQDGDKLNCTRRNLRPASRTQNNANACMRGGSSSFKGVCWHPRIKRWVAYLSAQRKRHHLGSFTEERAAAAAYNAAARIHFGEFARLNPL